MFTGIITHQGQIASIRSNKNGKDFVIESDLPLKKVPIGSSVAIDGACYTITNKKGKEFTVHSMRETLDKTIAPDYKKGSYVNLELPLKAGDLMGGHFVSGHIDYRGKVLKIKGKGSSVEIIISVPFNHQRYFTQKGSVNCNGISLTVTNVTKKHFTVNVIPHTLLQTNIHKLKQGDLVNIEVDILAKHIESLINR